MRRQRTMTKSGQSEPCPHKRSTLCSLLLPYCCACADKRPVASGYLAYVDGVGETMRGTRWQGYCLECKGPHRTHRDSVGYRLDGPIRRKPSKNVTVVSEIAGDHHSIEYVPSANLTVGSLRDNMAALLKCHPSTLVLSADGLELTNDLERHGDGLEFSLMGYIKCSLRSKLDIDYNMMDVEDSVDD
ncbi:hypothetical protein K469DRAFT_164773 [Zopfia rhizophila CBS 207.26]|uniref:Uncharacterized protein n=1 Tax=Zopfia rhizophila CBS 207.26 TaxID=1314779 RepID=A0A6A6E3Y4_9PEZI|nr:hypothetical protein K469DRAFT_164773 [Zopfia rhizophila CBS 207.26]